VCPPAKPMCILPVVYRICIYRLNTVPLCSIHRYACIYRPMCILPVYILHKGTVLSLYIHYRKALFRALSRMCACRRSLRLRHHLEPIYTHTTALNTACRCTALFRMCACRPSLRLTPAEKRPTTVSKET
jgi:hypothetical protein